ncbi:MAG TPA: hypothetical protein VN516_02270, partial [Candidatus Baltobacteraceae bacterium]|nr:hypothetical protein [Candidatus Baltobacteraceae bacterium]
RIARVVSSGDNSAINCFIRRGNKSNAAQKICTSSSPGFKSRGGSGQRDSEVRIPTPFAR